MADKKKAIGTPVTIEIGESELRFDITLKAFNDYQDEFMPNAKIAASENFLSKCVHPEDKEQLFEFCDKGYTFEIAQYVAEEFKPALSIKVKR